MSTGAQNFKPHWPHRIGAVALDMDGLMFDTEPLYYEVGMELLQRRGHSFSLALQQQMMGRPKSDAVDVLIEAFGLEDSPEQLMSESDEIYAKKIAGDLKSMPGLFEFLEQLDSKSIPYGVATSSQWQFAKPMLESFDLIPRLAFVLTGDDVTNGKPAPDMYLLAARRFDVPPHELMVLEDSGNGLKAAVVAGACAIAVPGAHSADHDFQGATLIADTLLDKRLWQLI